MLVLPPMNHCACGASHFSTVSHFVNQSSSLSAIRAQNISGSAAASARSASSSSIDLKCALAANSAGGGNVRPSCCSDSMLVAGDDMVAAYITTAESQNAAMCGGKPESLRLSVQSLKTH